MNDAGKPIIVQNPKWLLRGYTDFVRFISAAKQPVVLLEGSRNAPDEVQSKMEQLAADLMRTFPSLWGIGITLANARKRRLRYSTSTQTKRTAAARAIPS